VGVNSKFLQLDVRGTQVYNLLLTNLNITQFLVLKVAGTKWSDRRWISAAYLFLMTTLTKDNYLDAQDCLKFFYIPEKSKYYSNV